jgi:hypothetical protein
MNFAEGVLMFLTNPTIEELVHLDMSTLVDMLVEHTSSYNLFMREEGHSRKTLACRDSILSIHAAIEMKRKPIRNLSSKSDPAS